MKNNLLKWLILSLIFILLKFDLAAQTTPFSSSNLPVIVINTHGNQIQNEPKIEADMGIIFNGDSARNDITDSFNNFNGKIGIEIRGSSSQMFPKKQYGIEIIDSLGEDLDVSLLGFPKESDWILSAPYTDKSLMRDVLTYKIWNSMGWYATRSKFCELVINNEYMGVYVLFEKIKRNKNRVNVSKITPADTSGNSLTGGYIFKIDKTDGSGNGGWNSSFVPYPGSSQRVYYQYDYPNAGSITTSQKQYIQNTVREFESVMILPDYADSTTGYAKYIDVNSFIDYFLINELSKNVDGYRLSTYLHKDRDSIDSRLKMGPVWDYNLAFGNSDYFDASLVQGFHITYLITSTSFHSSDPFQLPFWWKKLFDEPGFKKKLNARWNELRKNEFSQEKIYSYIDSLTVLLNESRIRNFQKWNIIGKYVWPNYFIGKTYEEEINYLKTWIKNRISWMDSQFPKTAVGVENEYADIKGYYLHQNYPNPFNPVTTIVYAAGVEGHVSLKVFDILGKEITTLVNEDKPAGKYEVEFNGNTLTSGIYFYKLTAGDFVQTKKLILVK